MTPSLRFRAAVIVVASCALFVGATPASARGRKLGVLVVDGAALPAGLEGALAASLAPEVEIVHGPSAAADTRVRFILVGSAARIVVEDTVTQKTVERTVSLDGIPEDARAVALASAADGLLRASWLEAASAPPAKAAPPSAAPAHEEARAVAAQVARAALAPKDGPRIGARLSFEHANAGATLVGGDATVSLRIVGPLRLGVSAGARGLLGEETTNGSISGHALALGATLAYRVLPTRSWLALEVGPAFDFSWLVVRGDTSAPRVGLGASGAACVVGATVAARVPIARGFHLELAPTFGAAVREVRMRDSGIAASGIGGAVIGVRLAIDAQP